MGELTVLDVVWGRAAVMRPGGGLDLVLAEDHGPGVRSVGLTEEGRSAVTGGGALPLEDVRSLVPVVGHFR